MIDLLNNKRGENWLYTPGTELRVAIKGQWDLACTQNDFLVRMKLRVSSEQSDGNCVMVE